MECYETMREQIVDLTKVGHKALSSGSHLEACEIFRSAYTQAGQLNNDFILRGCSFNLGACHVACGQASVGLPYLEKAIPADDIEDGVENYADLWYNIGVARHAVGDIERALIAYEKASMGYKELDSRKLEAECLSKLAVCYHLQGQLENSYSMYEKSQVIYGSIPDKSNQALCLLNATGVLSELGDIDRCAKVLDILLDICQSIEDKHLQAKIYHDIGLLYISEKLYESAGECFEQALKCLQHHLVEDRVLKATVLQNLGASSNHLNLYEQAVQYHEAAADLYGELGDRHAQTQVFGNLAFAHTQIGNYQDAIMAFKHSIQAAKDCGDKETQCLATEGIAALRFRLNDHEKAITCYKDALVLLSMTTAKNSEDADRIIQKLTDAIQSQLLEEGKNIERKHAEHLVTQYRGEIHKRRNPRPNLSKNVQQSLIAKGLGGGESSYEDSSDQDSGSDNLEDSVHVHEQVEHYSLRKDKRKKQANKKPKGTRLKDDGMNFSMKSTLSGSHYYEQAKEGQEETVFQAGPEDYAANIPRADIEYDLATLAQKQISLKQVDKQYNTQELKESSRMCSVM